MIENSESVLEFWFGGGATAIEVEKEKNALWWNKNDRVDREISRRFAATTEAAANGELDHWVHAPRSLLALILCTDQFPRNMYRDTPRAFSYDAISLSLARRCVDQGMDRRLAPIQRVFVYLPFEHSEAPAEQERSIILFRTLVKSMDAHEAGLFDGFLDYARKHYEVIERFGRFPHRNRILQRRSTDEELTFLEQPESSF